MLEMIHDLFIATITMARFTVFAQLVWIEKISSPYTKRDFKVQKLEGSNLETRLRKLDPKGTFKVQLQ